MIHRVRLISILFAFQFSLASSIQLEQSIIPKINCQDINNNGYLDFIAEENSSTPRTLYWIEIQNDTTYNLWEYSMPDDYIGYFSDHIMGDINNDGKSELISLAYQENRSDIFYIFTLDSIKSSFGIPNIIGINNYKNKISHPQKLHLLSKMENNSTPFLLIQGSPNRNIIMCEYLNFKINEIGTFGKNFLNKSFGPLSIVTGNFNNDKIEDIFVLSNGLKPKGYFYFSDGTEKEMDFTNYSHLDLVNKDGVDINFDGIDDILMIDEKGNLISNIWEEKSISLLDSSISNITFKMDDGLIYINTVNNFGKIGQLTLDPLTASLISSNFLPSGFSNNDSLIINSLISENEILLISEQKKSMIISKNLISDSVINNNDSTKNKIYDSPPDFIIQLGEDFSHSISNDTAKAFLYFVGNDLPDGMEFNLDSINLQWLPQENDIGFHELSYSLEVREKGDLEIEVQNDVQSVSQKENIIDGQFNYLIYVNSPIQFKEEKKRIKIVNKEYHEESIILLDSNKDANVTLEIDNFTGDANFLLANLNSVIDSLDQESSLVNDSLINDINIEGIFSWMPDTINDSLIFKLLVSDGYSSDTLELTTLIHPEIDLSSNIVNYEFTVNQSIMIPIKVEQLKPSGSYNYELENAPENMWIDEEGVIHWIPLQTQIDKHTFLVNVSDDFALSSISLNININAVPVISSRPPENFYLNLKDSLSFSLESFDMNMDPTLNWKLISSPDGMILNNEGILKWEANKLDYHYYDIQLSDGIDSVMWTGSIYVNEIPLIVSTPQSIATVNKTYEYFIKVKDNNLMSPTNPEIENKIQYELLSGPEKMQITNNKIYWTPDSNSSGYHDIVIKVKDGMEEINQQFQLKVNSLPIFSSEDSVLVMFGDTLQFTFNAQDLNIDDSLMFIIENQTIEMELNEKSGFLKWFPLESNIGINEFIIKVLDGNENSETTQKFKVHVYKLPVFTGDLLTEAFVGLEFAGFISGRDMHEIKLRDEIAINIDSTTMTDFTLSEYGRYLQWVPTKTDIGKQEIKVKIMDELGFINYYTHYFTVFNNPCHQCKDNSSTSPVDTTTIK